MIAIVIPVHNRREFTRKCLQSLQEQSVQDHRVIVVDDGSTDGTAEMIRDDFPEVTVLRGNGQLYWTAAINMGIRNALEAGADHIMTLNNDTYAAPDFIEKMLFWANKKPEALLGALDIDAVSQKPYYGGERINRLWATQTLLLKVLPQSQWQGLHRVSLFPARGLLIPRKVFETIGLFAEKELPHYMADYDFTEKARRHGFELFCNYDAKLFTYPEEGGDHKIRRHKSLRNYYNHLFGIKGGGNLRNFTIYTFRNSPAILIPFHLLKGYTQRLFGYFIH